MKTWNRLLLGIGLAALLLTSCGQTRPLPETESSVFSVVSEVSESFESSEVSEASEVSVPEESSALEESSAESGESSAAEESAAPAESSTPEEPVSSQPAESSAPAEPSSEPEPAESSAPPEKDRYQTDPIPEGKPKPVEPQDVQVDTKTAYTCTLSIRCDTILDNMDKFNMDKESVLPADGVIFAEQTVTFYEGESVFDVLLRETRNNKIHMEFTNTPMYNSCYIEGIHNLYEFDCGSLSGWMYRVNGWFPNYGCSRYQLKDGDKVEWLYTCDLGRDLGCDWLGGTE